MSFPTGTVTFLFTDIEGSTRLWESQPEAMRVALGRHDTLMREAIAAHQGHIFKTIGDAFCAAFATADAALGAALAAQTALVAEPWATTAPLKVRMALHTGAAESRDGDYFGQPLNRVARLLAVGHGGQVLLTQATQELVRDRLPMEAHLKQLGEIRLRDLQAPIMVHQLLHPLLPQTFPVLRTLEAFPNNLPSQLTSFVGRESELAEITTLVTTHRLVTLTGSGGVGKTRLSLQVAADLLSHFPGGVFFVELAAVTDPALVLPSLLRAISLPELPGKPLLETLLEYLQQRVLLLVLDNCEHLLDSCAQLVQTLLVRATRLTVLASSREALGVPGEATYRVPSLSLPQLHLTPEKITESEAARLFVERAQTVQPSFAVTSNNVAAISSLCTRLDGIPLAIELAAARTRALSVEQLVERLDDRFRLLTGGARTALPRQQTLRALIDWSYSLLTDPEKVLLRRLAVFAGGWALESAEQVCSDAPLEEWEVLDLLTSLVDKSLVLFSPEAGRYRLLETIRQYARDRLNESDEASALRNRHRDYFMARADQLWQLSRHEGEQQLPPELRVEADNFLAALEWAQSDPGQRRPTLALAGKLRHLWESEGAHDGFRRLQEILALPGAEEPTPERVQALLAATRLAYITDEAEKGCVLLDEAEALLQATGNGEESIFCHQLRAHLYMSLGRPEEARRSLAAAMALAEQSNNPATVANLLTEITFASLHRPQEAQAWQEKALACAVQSGSAATIAYAHHAGAVVWLVSNDLTAARECIEEAIALRRTSTVPWLLASSLRFRAQIALLQEDWEQAGTDAQEALRIVGPQGNRGIRAAALGVQATILSEQGNVEQAKQCLELALRLEEGLQSFGRLMNRVLLLHIELAMGNDIREPLLTLLPLMDSPSGGRHFLFLFVLYAVQQGRDRAAAQALGLVPSPTAPRQRQRFQNLIASLRSRLGDSTFDAALTQGQMLSPYALAQAALGLSEGLDA